MANSSAPQSHRPWREIAKQASEEHDINKALELAQELIRALDAESNRRMEQVSAADKARERGAA